MLPRRRSTDEQRCDYRDNGALASPAGLNACSPCVACACHDAGAGAARREKEGARIAAFETAVFGDPARAQPFAAGIPFHDASRVRRGGRCRSPLTLTGMPAGCLAMLEATQDACCCNAVCLACADLHDTRAALCRALRRCLGALSLRRCRAAVVIWRLKRPICTRRVYMTLLRAAAVPVRRGCRLKDTVGLVRALP